ncbi:heat-inducible transcription repressor HrcA [Actinomyces sp. oral taxon 849 str. F0330]|uniref:heat-inducible transcriptional repressor HrcA n=1 Tax=Actinomyces sp. oral taxon 849 TaxID=653385 RepID=UPI000243007E|nr:heat-inducible transcriptional repressor HrcA [Actinomyces sp. oral taxon 849]EHM93361.1 heat-inducible transcription repressor HrcA [Actinomyces sp. oral taxon 849 str. F0330]
MANDRRLKVLSAIVTDYVRTREPVGSKALVERYRLGVSPATIRNDMAALEDEGYIHQPHTSAGRVPTQKGYRRFVDEVARIKPLSAPERAAITALLSGAVDLEQVVARTVRALAQLTGQLAVVEYPSLRYAALQHLELVALGPERILLVIITDTGRVDQRTVTLRTRTAAGNRRDGGFDVTDVVDPLVLERLRTRLNGALVGNRAADVGPILAALAEQATADERHLLDAVADELIDALRPDAEERLVVAGTANLARSTPDFSSLGPLLDAIEEQVVLLRLFTADDSPTGENRMRVSIGSENNDDALAEASVVTTTYGPGSGEAVAHLGVIGPTRMDYPATMTAVRAVARYLSRFLSPPET